MTQQTKPIQKRAHATRAKLIDTAKAVIAVQSYGAMRVEQVVQQAGVAKGTFFAHFPDKDALLDLIVGDELNLYLDDIEQKSTPDDVADFVVQLMPILNFMAQERYLFDLIIRHSGAAAKEELGPIARTFDRQIAVLAKWLTIGPFRKDVSATLLAEGVQAFVIQAIALHFCAVHGDASIQSRLTIYLEAWLRPQGAPL